MATKEGQNVGEKSIAHELLTKVRVQVSVPQCVGTAEESLPFSIRLRTEGISRDECAKLRVTSFAVSVEQNEQYRYVLSDIPTFVS